MSLLLMSLLPGTLAVAAESLDLKQSERQRVLTAADKYMNEPPITLTAYKAPRSPGGPHDYFSEGDYWWPDPKNPHGPYIQRDGMSNPDNFNDHRLALIRMSIQVPALVAAYRITGDAKYARHAIDHLNAWFVDAATRMNPNLQYAQAIHGRYTGRSFGIIDTLHLVEVARAILVLRESKQLPADEDAKITHWFAEYLNWLTTSAFGHKEGTSGNNHETCYWLQVASFATVTGDDAKLQAARDRFKTKLLAQMNDEGGFPRELARTKPYSYSLFQLDQMATLCQVASTPSDNLWTYTDPAGHTMAKALAFMYPYVKDKSAWPHKPDVMFWEFWPVRSPAWLFGGLALKQDKYLDLWKTLDPNPTNPEVIRNLPVRQPVLWVE
jgi:hypothetical protein